MFQLLTVFIFEQTFLLQYISCKYDIYTTVSNLAGEASYSLIIKSLAAVQIEDRGKL